MLGPRDEGQLTSGTGGWTVSHRRWTGPEDGGHRAGERQAADVRRRSSLGTADRSNGSLTGPPPTQHLLGPLFSLFCVMIFDSHNLAGKRNTGRAGPQEDKDSKDVFSGGKNK